MSAVVLLPCAEESNQLFEECPLALEVRGAMHDDGRDALKHLDGQPRQRILVG